VNALEFLTLAAIVSFVAGAGCIIRAARHDPKWRVK
jgi:hypothetical protein